VFLSVLSPTLEDEGGKEKMSIEGARKNESGELLFVEGEEKVLGSEDVVSGDAFDIEVRYIGKDNQKW
jgi:hypothetical protein